MGRILLLPILVLAACGDAPPPAPTPPAAGGRPETRPVEAAGAAGYDAQGLRRSLDRTLDARDRQQQDLEAAQQQTRP